MKKLLLVILSLMVISNPVLAAETVGEKIEATGNDASRAVKKKVNRVKEKTCDVAGKNCTRKKIRNRVNETKDYSQDKVNEGVNVIDEDNNK